MRHQFLPRRPVADIVERFFGNMVGETFVAYAVAEPGEVEQRIGDRGQLPVDQRGQPARRIEGEERVGCADVAVDDAGVEIVRNIGAQPVAWERVADRKSPRLTYSH